MASIRDFQTQNETPAATSKFMQKAKENPFVPIGIGGMIGAVGYGFYNYKNRGNMKTSVYLMHLRVKAQSMVVGCMALGMAYTLIRDYLNKQNKASKQ